ncbi:MAG: TonB-dependent receptor [Vicinamibacterales bacterium]
MRRRVYLLLAAMLVALPAASYAQLGQTAVLIGVVTDTSGGAIPGATVTVTSPALIGGPRVAITGADGGYRFPSLAPGAYRVQVELQGFKTYLQENVRLELGQTITLNPVLDIGTLQESVTVTGEAPIVDTSSSAEQKNLSQEVMEMVPFTNRFGPGAMLLAPGVNPNNYTAYGSGGSSSNAYMIDGVDVSDPEGGTIWVFANHNWIQEVQVIGLGADAEYGGFTGVASNSLFRSGSNVFSGLFETIFENDALTGDNTTPELLDENPDLTPGKTDYITDSTFQIGGPIKRDKAWFFTSFQYYRPKTAPAGFPKVEVSGAPSARLESSPRFLFKPTLQLGTSDKLTGFFEIDSYTVDGRGAGATVSPIATVHQDSPELSWNVNYTKILSSTTVFDVKYSGFWGYYYLTPYGGDNTPGWYDVSEDFYSVNSYYYYNADRRRSQANAAVTHYASGFAGDHNFKFGVEFERSYVKSEYGYPGDMYIFADAGVPYGAYFYEGYLKDNVNTRTAVYAQDSWQVNRRLTINPGVRVDMHRGHNQDLDQTVFKTNPVAPRIGFAFDLTGEGKTVIKAHYGLYYDGAKSTYYDPIGPNIAPVMYADIDPVTLEPLYEPYVTRPGAAATLDSGLKHPRMRQFIAGFDHEIAPGWAFGVTGIYRKNDQFIDDVLQNGVFTEEPLSDPGPDGVPGTGDETGTTITTYAQDNDALENRYLITNPSIAYREYKGVDINLKRRYANRWMFDLSWVISKIKGNIDNTGSFGNTTEFDDPNQDPRFQPFRDGTLARDNTHLVKLLGVYTLPWDIQASGAFFYTTGNAFTRTVRVSLPQNRKDLFIEPRGSQRYDAEPRLDFKLEKQFRISDTGRLGLTLEAFNVTNTAAVTSRTTRSGSSYFTPTGLTNPRRWRIGAVYRF